MSRRAQGWHENDSDVVLGVGVIERILLTSGQLTDVLNVTVKNLALRSGKLILSFESATGLGFRCAKYVGKSFLGCDVAKNADGEFVIPCDGEGFSSVFLSSSDALSGVLSIYIEKDSEEIDLPDPDEPWDATESRYNSDADVEPIKVSLRKLVTQPRRRGS